MRCSRSSTPHDEPDTFAVQCGADGDSSRSLRTSERPADSYRLSEWCSTVGRDARFERRRAVTQHPAASGVSPSGRGLLRTTLRSPLVWLCAIFLLIYVGVEVSLGAWSFSLLTGGRGIATLQAGWMVSGYWFGLTLGRFILARVTSMPK